MAIDKEKEFDVSQLLDFDYIQKKVLNNLDEIVLIDIQTGFGGKILRKIEILRRDVLNSAMTGASLNVISGIFGIDRKTCAKHFKKEIQYAHGLARWHLQNKMFVEAMKSNNPTERIFLAKNMLNMTDNGATEDMFDEDEGIEFKVKRPEKNTTNIEIIDDDVQIEYEDATGENS
jgi:hypothetical protein